MENHLLTLCCILLPAISWTEGAPVHDVRQRQVDQANGPHDVRWRLVTGLETTFYYVAILKDQVSACDNHQPFLSVGEDLKNILNGVCELMAVQAVTAKVHNGSDLQSVLEQNIIDSCHWLNHLVGSGEITASVRFLEMNDTCAIEDMPRLSQYCLESKLESFYDRVYLPASDYYSGTVAGQNVLQWLESQLPEKQTEVVQTLLWLPGQNFTCPFSL